MTTTRLDSHCLRTYANVPLEAHRDHEGIEEGARRGVERKNICKKIKKCGANIVLEQKSILQELYNELSLHFLEKMGMLVETDVKRTGVELTCRMLRCTPVPHIDSLSPEKLGSAKQIGDVVSSGWGTGSSISWACQIPGGP
jgi:chaperonin GroEL (HSP60 family)